MDPQDAQRDQNHVPVILTYNYLSGMTQEALVDPVTGYLEVEFQPWDDYMGISPAGDARRDQNRRTVGLTVSNDGNETITMLAANEVTGLLWMEYV